MKGIVFTEFLEMVEDQFGPAVADRMIVDAALPSGGVYTAVGTYDHRELVAMVGQLAARTNVPPSTLVTAFGKHLFGRFVTLFPQYFIEVPSAFAFLSKIESVIHPEVRKLYPDAELPRFDVGASDAGRLELLYRSSRHFGDLAEGLIRGCLDHFGESATVGRADTIAADGSAAILFTLRRTGPDAA